eukprot:5913085-Amphidinium_carterae.1
MAIVTQHVVWVAAHAQLNYPSRKIMCTITSNHHQGVDRRKANILQDASHHRPPGEIGEQSDKWEIH